MLTSITTAKALLEAQEKELCEHEAYMAEIKGIDLEAPARFATLKCVNKVAKNLQDALDGLSNAKENNENIKKQMRRRCFKLKIGSDALGVLDIFFSLASFCISSLFVRSVL
ncbi:hypothetical protein AMTR_s00120p00049990 [Amborella trichopoda]|uniref:Uncharacterized protein n=1 Tax=Amborella trichopoda TaxID=13333 RepID=W1NP24_AMBTC|nr:hypothetical protein AMTR_s00120p00049990 [Amborella trichopoda]